MGFFKQKMDFVLCMQKTAYEVRFSDWSSDVCASDLATLSGRIHDRAHDQAVCATVRGLDGMMGLFCRFQALFSGLCIGIEGCFIQTGRKYYYNYNDLFTNSSTAPPAWYISGVHLLNEIGRASCREIVCQYV